MSKSWDEAKRELLKDDETREAYESMTVEEVLSELSYNLNDITQRYYSRQIPDITKATEMRDEVTKQAIADINRIRVQDRIGILQKVKGMGVYNVDRPDDHFVWSWKIDREVSELQNQLGKESE